ncbi:MAG: DUF1624 domain-containing protein [Chitinivibrionales bacterium]|nr:DUF1624 domain-containing protein [Chitinivibrionales bacterium]
MNTYSKRIYAFDMLRGIVMILMTIDHAGIVFDKFHFSRDSWFNYSSATIPHLQFIVRWITHTCAVTFIFLAGTSLALSIGRKKSESISAAPAIDRHIFFRALFFIGIELFYWNKFCLQVLFAIAMCYLCMIFLRRLAWRLNLIIALFLLIFNELAVHSFFSLADIDLFVIKSSARGAYIDIGAIRLLFPFVHPGIPFQVGSIKINVLYPFLPWLPLMIFGWLFGEFINNKGKALLYTPKFHRLLAFGSLILITLALMLKYINRYGNMFVYREGLSLVNWLYISKYPPSLTYFMYQTGIMLALMLLCLKIEAKKERIALFNPLIVFGQTAFFFYLIHKHVMLLPAKLFHIEGELNIWPALLAAVITMIVMYPLCILFRRVKRQRSFFILRYI